MTRVTPVTRGARPTRSTRARGCALLAVAAAVAAAACGRATPRTAPSPRAARGDTSTRDTSVGARGDTARAPIVVPTAPATTAPAQRRTSAQRQRSNAGAAAQCRVVNFNQLPGDPSARLNSNKDAQNQNIVYVGGGSVARCEGVNNRLASDSAEYYQAAGLLVLIGNVVYDEPARAHMTALRSTYYTKEERILAEGNVVVTLPSGTTMTGPNAEYLRPVPPIRTTSRLTATGRPTIRLIGGTQPDARPASPTANARPDTSTTVIVANTVVDEADSVVYASGQVDITRTDVLANSDSAVFEQESETAHLLRNARIRGTQGRPYTLTGQIVDLYTRERQLSRVFARPDAQVTNDSLTLTSDTVDLRLTAGVADRAFAWGPKRATAVSPDRDLIADSIAAYLPKQRVREIHALRKAVARSVPDTARVRSTERDVLRGDTIVARFDTLAALRDTNKTPPLRQLVAVGSATAFNQLASREGREGRPALNYVRGRIITVDLDSGQAREVTVIGRSDGVYLEPSDTTRPADSTAPPKRAPARGGRPGGRPSRGPNPDSPDVVAPLTVAPRGAEAVARASTGSSR
ncbi:hypothetical protein tb265_38710 [Gemmatimonadetes bacterium T265]|nr:hypothetical protein tb265_38710 [Gemmatimonadetes bacterium T265]